MRKRHVRNGVISCLADGHWWTTGELAQTVRCRQSKVEEIIAWLAERGFVELFDDEEPEMWGWTVEPKAVERAHG